MNVIAVIPARSGSKGLPHKNIKKLSGKPLLAYSIMSAKKTRLVNRVIVSTDSEDYANLALKYKAEVPFLRPPELADDTSTDYDFVKHLLDWMVKNESSLPDYLIHLRPTTPYRDPNVLNDAISKFMHNDNATALRSAHETPETAYKQFEIENNYFKTICDGSFELDKQNSNRQSFPKTYTPNGYVDVLNTSFILENNLLHGNRVMSYLTEYSTEVDTLDDFNYLEWQSNKYDHIIKKLFES